LKVTVDWLKKYVDFDFSAEEIAKRITLLGLEVDGLKSLTYDFDNVVTGLVKEVSPVPGSDHLSVCKVDVGDKILQVVCGAPNVRKNLVVAVAMVGAVLPHNFTIKNAKIKGVDSAGMICSAAELGIASQSDIILELDQNIPIGMDFKKHLGCGEDVIEIDITSNRPDCLGVIGIAREITTISDSSLNKPDTKITESPDKKVDDYIKVVIENSDNCPRYTARYIEDVKIGPSPLWLIKKLEAIGIRSINNVVDITNYVMMETGQPLHAFDYDMISDGTIIVKNSTAGDVFTTLDEIERKLDDNACMICDADKPVALGGVMGGLNSEISEGTTRILLESAYFNPDNIRSTSKRLGLSTDSSQRFERGVDYNGLIYALNRATSLFCEIAGGTAASGYVDNYPKKIEDKRVTLRISRVEKVLGAQIPVDRMIAILRSLDFEVTLDGNEIHVIVPSHRPDVSIEEDLIEEVARVYGYNNIQGNNSSNIKLQSLVNHYELFAEEVRSLSTGMGYNEIVTNTLVQRFESDPFSEYEPINVSNPLSEDLSTLRTSLVPSALLVARWNLNRRNLNFKFFEIGNTFHWLEKNKKHHENVNLVYIGAGNVREGVWLEHDRPFSFHDIKGDVDAALHRLNVSNYSFKNSTVTFLDHRQLDIYVGNKKIGYLGAVDKKILKLFDIKSDVFVAELDFKGLLALKRWEKTYSSIPKFPSIYRDLSFLVNNDVPAQDILDVIWKAGGKYLKSVNLYDLFTGKQIEKNKKSMTFSLVYFTDERTLKEEEVDDSINNIIDSLQKILDIYLRK